MERLWTEDLRRLISDVCSVTATDSSRRGLNLLGRNHAWAVARHSIFAGAQEAGCLDACTAWVERQRASCVGLDQ